MDITFGDKDLKKYANNDRLAVRKLGPKRAQVFKQRLDDLRAADTLEDVRHLPGRYHKGISIKCDERTKSKADGAEKPECTLST